MTRTFQAKLTLCTARQIACRDKEELKISSLAGNPTLGMIDEY